MCQAGSSDSPYRDETMTIPKRRCKCTAGSKVGKPAQCPTQTDHYSGYCDECRYRCCDLQRHNLDHSQEGKATK